MVVADADAGVTAVAAGLESVVPAQIQRVPMPGVTGDLASYLQTMPGIVVQGDRGGQFFVRGGSLDQNLALLEARIDTLVLACTHYPLLSKLLREVVGPDVRLVDSADATARAAAELLASSGLAAPGGAAPRRHYFVTDDVARFRELARRFLGTEVDGVDSVVLDSEPGD